MSPQNNTLIQNLVLYGNSGRDNVLMAIIDAIKGGDKFGTVPMPLALKVSKHIFRILDQGKKPSMISYAMTFLMVMCETKQNSEAKSFVQSLENTTILKHCVHGCRQADAGQRVIWTHLLATYAFGNDKRSCEMLQYTGLLEAVLFVVDSFAPHNDEQEIEAVNHAIRTLLFFLMCTHPLERIVRAGGRQVLDSLLGKVAPLSIATMSIPEEHYTGVISNCANTCRVCYMALKRRQNELIKAGLSVADIFYGTEQAVQIMENWYLVFLYFWTTRTALNHVSNNIASVLQFCAASYAQTAEHTQSASHGIVASETMLCRVFALKANVLGDPSVNYTFIELLLMFAVPLECETHSAYIFQLVCEYPSLKAVVERCMGRYRYCAHPDCIVSSFVHGALRKCARCRSHSVWYCGKEHQIAHWPEHKLTCKRHNSSNVVKSV